MTAGVASAREPSKATPNTFVCEDELRKSKKSERKWIKSVFVLTCPILHLIQLDSFFFFFFLFFFLPYQSGAW